MFRCLPRSVFWLIRNGKNGSRTHLCQKLIFYSEIYTAHVILEEHSVDTLPVIG